MDFERFPGGVEEDFPIHDYEYWDIAVTQDLIRHGEPKDEIEAQARVERLAPRLTKEFLDMVEAGVIPSW